MWGEWGPGDPVGASWAIGCLGTVAPLSGWGLCQVQRVRENVPVSSGAVPPASERGTGSTAAMRGGGMDIQPHYNKANRKDGMRQGEQSMEWSPAVSAAHPLWDRDSPGSSVLPVPASTAELLPPPGLPSSPSTTC